MIEQQNVEKVQQMYAAFGRGDIQAILNETAEDVIWEQPGSSVMPTAGRYRGREGVKTFFDRVEAAWAFESFEPQEFVAQGEKVVALGYYRARAKTTGRLMEANWAMVFTLRNGKLVHFREYTDTAAGEAAHR